MQGSNGIAMPSLEVIERWHPLYALAVYRGAKMRPDTRTQSVTFSTSTPAVQLPSTWDDKITSFSLFAGLAVTIDPTNQFSGNPLKTLSDTMQKFVSGITYSFQVQASKDVYYAPISTATPLQNVEPVFNPMAGMWAFREPENIKSQFTSVVAVPAGGTTVWITWGFAVLSGPECDCLDGYMTNEQARAEIMAMRCREKLLCDLIMKRWENEGGKVSPPLPTPPKVT